MRHGFKAHAKRLALELRDEIGLTPYLPFNPWALAELYGIEVHRLSDLDCSAEAKRRFMLDKTEIFSGALIPLAPSGATILENDGHALVRRRSTTSHEMAHLVLEHRFDTMIVNERGCRAADSEHEEEANELAGEMLLPFEAAQALARRNASNAEAATQFAVSIDMARWRLDSTGARKIAKRQASYRQRA